MREVQSPEIENRLLGRPELKEKENINKSAQINLVTCHFSMSFCYIITMQNVTFNRICGHQFDKHK